MKAISASIIIILLVFMIGVSLLAYFNFLKTQMWTQGKNTTPPTTTSSSMITTTVQTNVYCIYPICDLIPKIYNLTASNNPSDYLGSMIYDEQPSNWESYQPLVNQVNKLIQNQNNDYSKAVAIANWVKSSRPYSYPSPANGWKSVTDIFNANTGVCLDAATLTTSMLRIANIPSRATSHLTIGFHEIAQAYVNGNWVYIDATFGDGGAFVSNQSLYSGTTYQFYASASNITDPAFPWQSAYANVSFFERKSIYQDIFKNSVGYGTLIYPITAKIAYYDSSTGQLSFTNSSQNAMPTFIMPAYLEAINQNCLQTVGVTLNPTATNGYLFNLPGFYYHAKSNNGQDATGVPWLSGYVVTEIPACHYRLYYGLNDQDLDINQTLAYSDFQINNGDTVVITPQSLQIVTGANQNYFNILVQALNSIPSYQTLSTK